MVTAGWRGTYVIAGRQSEIDGARSRDVPGLGVGSLWRWTGQAICLDAPHDLLLLGSALGERDVRRRAGRRVRRFLGDFVDAPAPRGLDTLDPGTSGGFVLTDGRNAYAGALIAGTSDWLSVFSDRLPPADRDLWVVEVSPAPAPPPRPARARGMVCFTPDTPVATPLGRRRVAEIAPGDRVETRDAGPQPVIWAGTTEFDPGGLPDAAQPVAIAAGAFGPGAPGDRLLVSPDHRILLAGPAARALFDSDEVLVAARDLVGRPGVSRRRVTGPLTYHHLMLERHQVIWAGGLACESFHPADADLFGLEDSQRLTLLGVAPDVFADAAVYGPHARRCLSTAEAAILSGAPA